MVRLSMNPPPRHASRRGRTGRSIDRTQCGLELKEAHGPVDCSRERGYGGGVAPVPFARLFGGGRRAVESIVPRRTFDDVILPSATRRALDTALAQVTQHDLIFNRWGLGERHPTGLALAFNFAGPSGTGKTICAEAIAHSLGRRLLPTDRSLDTHISNLRRKIQRATAQVTLKSVRGTGYALALADAPEPERATPIS